MTKIAILEACRLWLERCKLEKLERSTIQSYSAHVKHHIGPRLGHILLEELTAADIRIFLDNMLAETSRACAKKNLTSLRSIIT